MQAEVKSEAFKRKLTLGLGGAALLSAALSRRFGVASVLRISLRFDAFPQRTLKWLSLPVLTVPFWSRPAFVAQSADAESKHRKFSRFPAIAPGRDGHKIGRR